ncbi:universal stress protein [Thetidibacter halocola]|uniref:Universal stress protein n=1 Tax=Thetidibacter halocola TaxID=2827239 RepID=A0A8J8B7Z7_9RHOB|nr:universal stress protein [Thetidibacter halocola]MBS0124050.1 universal stress protein [Thetidibacter halocola]
MFDNVLLPIDLNHPASWEKALPMAARLCGPAGTLHVLGIVHDLGAAAVASYLPAGFEQHALQQMKADLDAFVAKEVPAGVQAQAHVEHGHVAEHILHAGRAVNADVIVMASHPPDEFMSFLVGSNADRVVRHADRPVLVVR